VFFYKQIIGIPKDGNASPFRTDLFLIQLEYVWMRYVKDYLDLNCDEIIRISKNYLPNRINSGTQSPDMMSRKVLIRLEY